MAINICEVRYCNVGRHAGWPGSSGAGCGGGRIADSKISLARRACLAARPPTLPFRSELRGRASSTVANGRAGEPLDLKRLMDLWGYCISHKHAHTYLHHHLHNHPQEDLELCCPARPILLPSHPPEAGCSRQNACAGSHSFNPSAAMLYSLGCLHALVSVARWFCQGSAGHPLDGGRG